MGRYRLTDEVGTFRFNETQAFIGIWGMQNLKEPKINQFGVIYYNTSCDPLTVAPPPPPEPEIIIEVQVETKIETVTEIVVETETVIEILEKNVTVIEI